MELDSSTVDPWRSNYVLGYFLLLFLFYLGKHDIFIMTTSQPPDSTAVLLGDWHMNSGSWITGLISHRDAWTVLKSDQWSVFCIVYAFLGLYQLWILLWLKPYDDPWYYRPCCGEIVVYFSSFSEIFFFFFFFFLERFGRCSKFWHTWHVNDVKINSRLYRKLIIYGHFYL